MSTRQRQAREHARQLKLAQERARAARRTRLIWATSVVAVVVVAFGVLIAVKLSAGGKTGPAAAVPTGADAAAIVTAATSVPATTLNTVGAGKVDALPKVLTGQALNTQDGKPAVLYVGAEYCPYCAAQRWPTVVALSRFGTFTGLKVTSSSSSDVFPDTATLSFHGATYTSTYLTFQGVETSSNVQQGQGYAPLDTLTADQQALITKYNAAPYLSKDEAGAIPFIDFGNQALVAGASYSPKLLAGKSANDIATAIADPGSEIAKSVDGSANAITALLCKLTNGQPGDVCGSAAVTAYQGKFDGVKNG